jgi:hypothetical protein
VTDRVIAAGRFVAADAFAVDAAWAEPNSRFRTNPTPQSRQHMSVLLVRRSMRHGPIVVANALGDIRRDLRRFCALAR